MQWFFFHVKKYNSPCLLVNKKNNNKSAIKTRTTKKQTEYLHLSFDNKMLTSLKTGYSSLVRNSLRSTAVIEKSHMYLYNYLHLATEIYQQLYYILIPIFIIYRLLGIFFIFVWNLKKKNNSARKQFLRKVPTNKMGGTT